MGLLLGVELLDELYSGVPSVGSAEIHAELSTSFATTLQVLFLVPGLVALVIEPILFLLADRYPRKWFVCGGLFAMGVAGILAALAENVWVLSVAMALSFLGSGCGVSLSQATLVDARPDAREQVLTRWTLLGEIGDLLAPLMLAGLAAAGLGWRTGYVIVSVVLFAWCAWVAFQRFPDAVAEDDEGPEPSLKESALAALRNRSLLLWLAGGALCDLLDEIVVVFGALHLETDLGMGPVARAIVIGSGVIGAIVGAALTELVLTKVSPLRLLLVSSVVCLACFAAWLMTEHIVLSAIWFGLVGCFAAPMFPIVSANAYAALPGRSGTVNAASHLFTPIALGLPFLLGLLADATDLRVALALLAVQPIGLMILATWAIRRARVEGSPPSAE